MVRIAVTGATGQLGGQVARILAAEGHHVVAVSRNRADSLPGVEPAVADYADPAALRAALSGVDALVFVSSDGDAAKMMLHHRNVVHAAADSGIAHVVALSGLDADLASPFCYGVTNGYTEQLLRDTGCPYSVVRASIFTEFFLHWLTAARSSGEIRLPAAAARLSLVARTDVGRCLAALAVAGPTGRHHDVTGPAALDLNVIAAEAAAHWRTPIRYVEVSPAEHCVEMARAGEHPWWMYAYSSMFTSVRQHRWAATSDEVAALTGRPATALRDLLT